jgi:hypothetical protein
MHKKRVLKHRQQGQHDPQEVQCNQQYLATKKGYEEVTEYESSS